MVFQEILGVFRLTLLGDRRIWREQHPVGEYLAEFVVKGWYSDGKRL